MPEQQKPIGKSYGGFYIYPVSPKRYRCERCGYETTQSTNHYQPTWSWGRQNVCPQCPPWAKYPEYGGSRVWIPVENDPAESGEQTHVESLVQEADELLPEPPEFKVDHLLDLATHSRENLAYLRKHPSLQNNPKVLASIDELTGKMDKRDHLLARLRFVMRLRRELKFKNATQDQVADLIPGRGTRYGERPAYIDGAVLKGSGKRIMFTRPIPYPPPEPGK